MNAKVMSISFHDDYDDVVVLVDAVVKVVLFSLI